MSPIHDRVARYAGAIWGDLSADEIDPLYEQLHTGKASARSLRWELPELRLIPMTTRRGRLT